MAIREVPSLSGVEKKRPFYSYIIIIASFLIFVTVAGIFNSYGVFFKPLLAEFDWTRSVPSGAFSLSMLMFGLMGIVTGRLTDRFGPKLVVAAGGLLIGIGYLAFSQIVSAWQLYLFFGLITGIGRGGCFVPIFSTVARWFVRRRGLATGITSAGVGIGCLVIPPIASQLIVLHGWRVTTIILGVVALVLICVPALFLKRDPGQPGQSDTSAGKKPEDKQGVSSRGFTFSEARHTREFWIICYIFFALILSTIAISVHLVPHATDTGISAVSAASILAVAGGVSSAGRIITGSIADRIGTKPALTIIIVLHVIVFLWLLAIREEWMFYVFAAVYGFAWGGGAVLQSPIIADLFGLQSHGVIMGIVQFAGTIGGAIGPLFAGILFDVTGNYVLSFISFAIIAFIGFILILFVRRNANLRDVQY